MLAVDASVTSESPMNVWLAHEARLMMMTGEKIASPVDLVLTLAW